MFTRPVPSPRTGSRAARAARPASGPSARRGGPAGSRWPASPPPWRRQRRPWPRSARPRRARRSASASAWARHLADPTSTSRCSVGVSEISGHRASESSRAEPPARRLDHRVQVVDRLAAHGSIQAPTTDRKGPLTCGYDHSRDAFGMLFANSGRAGRGVRLVVLTDRLLALAARPPPLAASATSVAPRGGLD